MHDWKKTLLKQSATMHEAIQTLNNESLRIVLNPDTLNGIDGKSYLDMPNLLSEKINGNRQVNMFPLHEYWLDVGQVEEFEKAQLDSQELFQ